MAFPPLAIDEATPGDSDIVSQFPAAERTFRNDLEDFLLTEHDTTGHHKLPIKTTAEKTAITDWVAGSLVYDTTLNQLQLVETIDPDVFVPAHVNQASEIATAMIQDDAVTFAKMQNITSDRLLGRDTASSGNVEEISLAAPLAWSGSASIGVDAATDSAAGKVELATAAEMVTGTDTGRVPSVSTVKNHEGVCKAWGSVTNGGSAALEDSYGVTSATRTGAGVVDVALSVTMANDDYAVVCTPMEDTNGLVACIRVTARTTTTFQVFTELPSDSFGFASDMDFSFAVFGTLA